MKLKQKEIEVLEQLLEDIYPNPIDNVLLLALVGIEQWIKTDKETNCKFRIREDEHTKLRIEQAIKELNTK